MFSPFSKPAGRDTVNYSTAPRELFQDIEDVVMKNEFN